MATSTIPTHCEETLIHPERVEAVRPALLDPSSAVQLADIFSAMADPTRLRLLSALKEMDMCVCDLAAVLGMTQSAVSHQLRYLRNLHVVRARKEGRVVYYSLDDEHIRALFDLGLEHFRHNEEH